MTQPVSLRHLNTHLSSAFLAIFTFATCSHATALDYSADLLIGSEYSDNAERQPNGLHDIETTAGLGVNLRHDTRELELTGDYQFNYRQFENSTNEDRSDITGNSAVRAQLLPQRLFWQLEHNITERRSRRNLVDNANNQERRNQISTGPDLRLNLSGADTLLVNARYTKILFSTPANANQGASDNATSYSGGAVWQHALSQITNLLLGVNYNETEREGNAVTADRTNEFQTAFIGFNRRLRELQYGLQLGSSQGEDQSGRSSSGLFYQAELVHSTGDSTLAINAGQQKTDTSRGRDANSVLFNQFSDFSTLVDTNLTQGNFDSEGVVEISSYEITYRTQRGCSRCNYGVGFSRVASDFENAGEVDDTEDRVNLNYSFRLNPRLNLTASTTWRKADFDIAPTIISDQEDTNSTLALRWQASQNLTVTVSGGHQERKLEEGANDRNTFGGITINYTLLDSAR